MVVMLLKILSVVTRRRFLVYNISGLLVCPIYRVLRKKEASFFPKTLKMGQTSDPETAIHPKTMPGNNPEDFKQQGQPYLYQVIYRQGDKKYRRPVVQGTGERVLSKPKGIISHKCETAPLQYWHSEKWQHCLSTPWFWVTVIYVTLCSCERTYSHNYAALFLLDWTGLFLPSSP